MSLRKILLWPDVRLSQVCAPVAPQEDLGSLIEDMFETMYAAPGRGLAAPQIGVMKRVFVMDIGWKDGEMTPLVCINPKIIAVSQEQDTQTEGCLSMPDAPVSVLRPQSVTLGWAGIDGRRHRVEMTGWEARCALHEYDHLDGRVIFDHLDPDLRAEVEGPYLAAQT